MASSGTAAVAGVTAQPAELMTVTMVKGAEGFGFTIADSPTGQRVKQVNGHLYFVCSPVIVYSGLIKYTTKKINQESSAQSK